MNHFLDSANQMPPESIFKGRLQSLAMLDAIIMPEWDRRYFSFNANWAPDQMMGSMRDGEGSEFFFLFCASGVVGKIFCKQEPKASPPNQILGKVPTEFAEFLNEPAFNLADITLCLWNRKQEGFWSFAPPQNGKIPLMAFIGDNGNYYANWAQKYYERGIPRPLVEAIFDHKSLTPSLNGLLNEREFPSIKEDALEIGYPIVG